MTLRELINELATPEHIDATEALDLEVEFRIIKRSKLFATTLMSNLSFLLAYKEDEKIIIDIGADK